jgi:hypothetical protein
MEAKNLEEYRRLRAKLSRDGQAILDKSALTLAQLAVEQLAEQSDGWIGVKMSTQAGALRGRPRKLIEVS